MDTITVFGSPTCMPCRSTKKSLDARGVIYDYRDVTTDPEALEHIHSLGYSGVPVVVVGDEHWQGYQPDRLAALAS